MTVPPSVKPIPSTGLAVVKKGEPVTLACEVSGNPLPVVTWTREVYSMTLTIPLSHYPEVYSFLILKSNLGTHFTRTLSNDFG